MNKNYSLTKVYLGRHSVTYKSSRQVSSYIMNSKTENYLICLENDLVQSSHDPYMPIS